ncbi:signal peptidase I [Sanguibacter sp. HDW7]|uniref:signal peptidase I n=1 Tax=Sanguibacter sp. HDW7 TaxID=2714931 RepID=UPI00140D2203|nr:signal peptidase I [Sanguibacter sp. HDW7]QIK82188.1 signal peptidase I [Sanguibacter sp. HDW7]
MVSRTASVVSRIVLLAGLALVVLVVVVPATTGAVALAVLTGSMAPTYPAGSLVVVRPVDVDELRAGDVVTYQAESGRATLVTHRVTGVEHRSDGTLRLVTQGDANRVPDPEPVRAEQVVGQVWYAVPHVGRLTTALDGHTRGAALALVAGALLAHGAWHVVTGLRERRRRPVAAPAAASGSEHRPGRAA